MRRQHGCSTWQVLMMAKRRATNRRPTFELTRAAYDAWAKRKLSGVAVERIVRWRPTGEDDGAATEDQNEHLGQH